MVLGPAGSRRFWDSGGPGGSETTSNRWAASRPAGWEGFAGGRPAGTSKFDDPPNVDLGLDLGSGLGLALVILAVHWQLGILIFPVFGRFSANLGPKTPLERRGSSCSAGCTQNQPRRRILRVISWQLRNLSGSLEGVNSEFRVATKWP